MRLVTRLAVARVLSVLGHPVLLLPSVVMWAIAARDAGPSVMRAAVLASVAAATAVAVFSWVQVKRGAWTHADASVPGERRQLNRFLVPLLWGLALLLAVTGQPLAVVLGMVLGGAMVVCAQALRHQMKLSLHVAFAVFAAALMWPHAGAVLSLLGLALAVSWSRCVLKRHTRAEVAAGWLAGLAAAGVWVSLAG